MGSFLSTSTSCLANEENFTCNLPDVFESDGDIAGRGVFYAFIAAVASSCAGALVVLFYEYKQYFGTTQKQSRAERLRMSADAFLVSLSDTQAVTTLALLISVNFYLGCTISAYHYDLICSLVLMSGSAHIGSVAVLHKYFDRRGGRGLLLIIIRLLMIIATFVLTIILFHHRLQSNIFPSFRPHNNVDKTGNSYSTGLVLPAACFIGHPGLGDSKGGKNYTASTRWITNVTATSISNSSYTHNFNSSFVDNNTMPIYSLFNSDDDLSSQGDLRALIVLGLIFPLTLLTTWVLHYWNKNVSTRHMIALGARICFLLGAYGVAVYGYIRFRGLQDWMLSSGWFDNSDGEIDDGETTFKSFGQLMPIILLALPGLAVAEQLLPEKPATEAQDYELTPSNKYNSMD